MIPVTLISVLQYNVELVVNLTAIYQTEKKFEILLS